MTPRLASAGPRVDLNSSTLPMSEPTDRRIDRLIRLFVEHATVVVPGPKLAAEIGVTRATVWEWVEKLRAQGVEIEGRNDGYRLRAVPDLLTPGFVRAALGDCTLGRKIVHYFAVGSTNSAALHLAAEGALHGTVVAAEEQTAGRGRFGRQWYSERGQGIYASVILRPPLAPSSAPVLTLMAGLALAQAVSDETGLAPDIRWPNDVLIGGKKAAGLLTEMSAEVDRIHSVVIGVGVNVNHPRMPEDIRSIATSLRIETGNSFSRARLLACFLHRLEAHYAILLDRGSAPIIKSWTMASSFALNKRVRVRTAAGESVAQTDGLELTGALRLRFEDGRRESLLSGEVIELK